MGDLRGPFLGSTALRTGLLTRHQLTLNRRLHHDVYLPPDLELTPLVRARAAALWAGDDGVLAGFSAAAVLGTKWIDASRGAEVIRTNSRRSTTGIVVRAGTLLPEEVIIRDNLRITGPARTAFDLARWLRMDNAIEVLDALLQATGTTAEQILELAAKHPGARGSKQLRMALELVDPGAQSPPETRTRLLLIRAGLPIPQTQVQVRNEWDFVIATCDLGWERWQVAVEYDGIQHWQSERQRTRDIFRYAELEEQGWQVVRVNARMLRDHQYMIVDRVRDKLRAAGCPL